MDQQVMTSSGFFILSTAIILGILLVKTLITFAGPYLKKHKPTLILIAIIAIAIAPLPYGLYPWIKFIVIVWFSWLALLAFLNERTAWTFFWLALIALFNPFWPVVLGKDAWVMVDIFVIASLILWMIKGETKLLEGDEVNEPDEHVEDQEETSSSLEDSKFVENKQVVDDEDSFLGNDYEPAEVFIFEKKRSPNNQELSKEKVTRMTPKLLKIVDQKIFKMLKEYYIEELDNDVTASSFARAITNYLTGVNFNMAHLSAFGKESIQDEASDWLNDNPELMELSIQSLRFKKSMADIGESEELLESYGHYYPDGISYKEYAKIVRGL